MVKDILLNVSEWMITTLVTGGLGVILYRHFFMDRGQRQTAQEKLMDTLQKMAFDNLEKLNNLQKDIDYWRREYHELVKSTDDLQKTYEHTIHENEKLKKQVDSLTRSYNDLKRKYEELIKREGNNVSN